jgi:hypothetical protein
MACPICNSNAAPVALDALEENWQINCLRCGQFRYTQPFAETRPNLTPSQVGTISGWVREHQNAQLGAGNWASLTALRTPSIGEKADKLLQFLARQFPNAGQAITFNPSPEILSTLWAVNDAEANYLFHHYLTKHKGFLTAPAQGGAIWTIAPAGWDYIHSLLRPNPTSQIGFCAMWFDDRLEPVWAEAIEPGIRDAKYEAKRIDKHPHNNRIDDEIIAMIRRSRFLVSDLTGNRPGVYYESGFAAGLGLPVVWTCRKDRLHLVHFDNRQFNFILWEADHLGQFKEALQYRIEATVGQGPLNE